MIYLKAVCDTKPNKGKESPYKCKGNCRVELVTDQENELARFTQAHYVNCLYYVGSRV